MLLKLLVQWFGSVELALIVIAFVLSVFAEWGLLVPRPSAHWLCGFAIVYVFAAKLIAAGAFSPAQKPDEPPKT